MSDQIIPVTSDPNQTFQAQVNIDGRNLTLEFFLSYNEVAEYWTIDIRYPPTGVPYICGIPLLPGVFPAANLLEQYAYLVIGSLYLLNVGGNPSEEPGNPNLGTDFVLAYSDTNPAAAVPVSVPQALLPTPSPVPQPETPYLMTDPDTTGWGLEHDGYRWYNMTAHQYKFWNGSAIHISGG
jgi:hypothetical protein